MHAADITATPIPLDSLTGTAKGLATAAQRAGYTIRATRALGPRIPRRPNDPTERTASLALTGVMGDWRFTASHTDRDGWDVVLHRPGWPVEIANIPRLRTLFTAQTPATLGAQCATTSTQPTLI